MHAPFCCPCLTRRLICRVEFQKAEDARDAFFQQEIRDLRAEVSQLRHVESENQSLKERNMVLSSNLQQAREDAAAKPHRDVGHVQSNRERSLEEELARTKTKCAHLKDSLDQAVALLRRRRDELEQRIRYADHQTADVIKLEEKLQTPVRGVPVDSVVNGSGTRYKNLGGDDIGRVEQVPNRPSLTPSPLAVSFGGAVAHADTSSETLQPPHQSPRRAISEPIEPTSGAAPIGLAEAVGSAASTQAETEAADYELPPQLPAAAAASSSPPPCIIKEEPSSDGPIHIMSRPVNKRKRTTPEPVGPTERVRRIKSDGSDPVVTGEFVYFDPQESMDLDEGQTTLETPRKRQQLLALSRLVGGNDVDGTPIATTRPPRPGKPMQGGGPAMASVGSLPTSRDGQPIRNTTPLRPISTNRRMIKTNDSRQQTKDAARWRFTDGLSEVAGDGHDYALADAATGDSLPTKGQGKLRSLLNAPSLENATPLPSRFQQQKTQGVPRSAPQAARLDPFLPPKLGTRAAAEATPTKAEPARKRSACSRSASPQKQLGSTDAARQKADLVGTRTGARAQDTPVRLKPLASLTRQDFKINPKYNEGEKFAFAEVVRGRADRGSLSGCVDPDCCGKFFGQMAQSERNAMGPSLVDEAGSIKLMEEYLGDDAHMLERMTQEKKEALWLKARIKELADKYGKHRHRFHRQASPPGFRDTGFPSTQEQQRERDEAEKMERALIAERYREAMRKGGRWLFRDE